LTFSARFPGVNVGQALSPDNRREAPAERMSMTAHQRPSHGFFIGALLSPLFASSYY
jgi:hypothetical protein